MEQLEALTAAFANFAWGIPLLILLVSGGIFFAFYSRFLPYRHIPHAVGILPGRYNNPNNEGNLGLGNIANRTTPRLNTVLSTASMLEYTVAKQE